MSKISRPILTSSSPAMSHRLIGGLSSVANSTASGISSGGWMDPSRKVDAETIEKRQHHMFPYKVYI